MTTRVDEQTVLYCMHNTPVLLVPMLVAVALRDVSRRWGLASETAASYASLQWCAHRATTTTGEQFGERAIGPSGLPATLTVTEDGGWQIDDNAVEKHEEWGKQSLVRLFSEANSEWEFFGSFRVPSTFRSEGLV